MIDGGGAYGAGKATGYFDARAFRRNPRVILRILSMKSAIVMFGCISSQGWTTDEETNRDICRYNGDANACGFGIVIGVLAFIGLVVLLGTDAMFDNISSVQHRKFVVIGDMVFSGTWTFFYLINSCYLADAWSRTDDDTAGEEWGDSGVVAAITFSFCSIALFAGLTSLAVHRYRSGVRELFTAGYEPDVLGGPPGHAGTQQLPYPPYPSYPTSGGAGGDQDPYPQKPFGAAGGGQDQEQHQTDLRTY